MYEYPGPVTQAAESTQLIYGHRASLSTALTKPLKANYNYDDYAEKLKEKLRAIQQIAKDRVQEEKIKAKKYYDKNTKETKFKVGEKALMYDETLR